MSVVSEKSWFGPCYSNCHVFKNAKKCCSFLVFTTLIVRWDLAFAGSFCRLLASGSARAFCCFFNNKFQEFFKNSYYSRPHLLAQNHVFLPNFWCFWRMTFREIEQFVLESWLVLVVVDNFRLHRFLHKKTPRRSWFFCVSVTDMNSFKKAIDFQVCLNSWQFVAASWCTDMEWNYTQKCMLLKRAKIIEKIVILLRVKRSYEIRLTWGGVGPCILIKHPKKETHFDSCTYRGFRFLHIFTVFEKLVFYGYHM